MVYLVTHGKRFGGFDPGHTPEGIGQIERIDLKKISSTISLVLVGTGRRFKKKGLSMLLTQTTKVSEKFNSKPYLHCLRAGRIKPISPFLLF